MAKYLTQPRRIGLIFSISPPTGWEREAPKICLSLPSNAVRTPLTQKVTSSLNG